MKFFLSAIYLFLLEMYYRHYVILEALPVICKQLKIIYYPKLYRSTNVCISISFIKNGVVLIYTDTHLHLSLWDTVCSVTFATRFRTWNKRGGLGEVKGHHWPLPGQVQPTGSLLRVLTLPLKTHRGDTALKSPLVPIFLHPGPFPHRLPSERVECWGFDLCVEWREDPIMLEKLLPLTPVPSSWIRGNDLTQQADTK